MFCIFVAAELIIHILSRDKVQLHLSGYVALCVRAATFVPLIVIAGLLHACIHH